MDVDEKPRPKPKPRPKEPADADEPPKKKVTEKTDYQTVSLRNLCTVSLCSPFSFTRYHFFTLTVLIAIKKMFATNEILRHYWR